MLKNVFKNDAESEASNWQDNFQLNDPILGGNQGTWIPMGGMHASGGFEYPGYSYRINDDAGHRNEFFVPLVPGYRLSGNQTDRIVNNNNSRTVGDVNIYVQSYGMYVAEVADELGAAFANKIRMSGEMI